MDYMKVREDLQLTEDGPASGLSEPQTSPDRAVWAFSHMRINCRAGDR